MMNVKQILGIQSPRQDVRREIAWRYLTGEGLEIGALHQPLAVPPSARVQYVDRMSVDDLRRHYPEFNSVPLVKVDIVDDAETLASVAEASRDFIIGNHLIEHCQNPIGTLYHWLRVLKPGGVLYLSVPDKRFTFDRERPVTTLEHLLRDYRETPICSRDEHFREWAHWVAHAPADKIEAESRKLMEQNYSIHYHVWTAMDFLSFIIHCRTALHMAFELELAQQNREEFIIILRKARGDSAHAGA